MRKRLYVLSIILLIFVTACGRSGWQFVSPMPHGRYWHDATLGKDGRIYVMGGMVMSVTEKRMVVPHNDGKYSNLVYDPDKDTWNYLTPIPGKILPGKFLTYDTKRNTWDWHRYHHGMQLPAKARRTDFRRRGDGVRTVRTSDGTIYWLGGKSFMGSGESRVLPYDPTKDTWPEVSDKDVRMSPMAIRVKTIYHTNMPPMLERRVAHEAVITSDGKIYALAGWRKLKNKESRGNVSKIRKIELSDTMECYDPKTNKWQYKKSLQVERMQFSAVVGPDDKIYVFGGAGGLSTRPSTPVLDTVEVYDPVTDTWISRGPMPAPRKSHAGVLGSDDKIYIMGGSSEVYGPPLNDVFIYDPVRDTWKKGPDMKIQRASLSAVATPDGKIYAIGGTDVGAYEGRETINFFLPRKLEFYRGKVQDTVEVLDISK